MFCKNCGNEISENGKFCSICGTKINSTEYNDKKIKLRITRAKSFIGCIRTMKVYIDKNHVGLIKNGELLTVDITPGEHSILIDFCGCVGEEKIVLSDKFDIFDIYISIEMGLITNKIKFSNLKGLKKGEM